MHKWFRLSLLAALSSVVVPSSVFAQEDPTQIGGGQLPYIMIVMDTSGSTEWTDAGDETYPVRDSAQYPLGVTFSGTNFPPTFVPGDPMVIGENGDSEQAGGPRMFGPCVVWEPDSCGSYDRPAWTFDAPDTWTEHYNDASFMNARAATYIRDVGPAAPRARLKQISQPRHVTMKEILTGDMILLTQDQVASGVDPETLDPDVYGPGCWFVPRQRGATIQKDDPYCVGDNEFEDLADYQEPSPHLQEVYDGQLTNGLLDSLSGAAIFAFAALDGYREDQSNDDMRGSPPPAPVAYRDVGTRDEDNDCAWSDENAVTYTSPCYDLGIYRVVGPTDLQIPSTFLGELSSYTQVAIRDSGFLSRNSGSDFELDPDAKKSEDKPWMGVRFSKDFKKYVDKFDLGNQPIGAGTPLAAAIHDVHQFFRDGQNGMEAIQDDEFKECRQKHVVMITDGYPEPERTGIGSEVLQPAFNYYVGRYTYAPILNELDEMRNDTQDRIPPAGTGWDRKYSPRVHVVGVRDNNAPDEVLEILHDMAIRGETCADYYLSNDWIPTTAGGNDCPRAALGGACLDTSITRFSIFDPPDPASPSHFCSWPALVLNTNSRDDIEAALSEIFNGIIGTAGVASRTRTVVTNNLDDASQPNGGQYRFFSGVEIGGSSFWSGIINRQTIDCDNSPASIDPIHVDIAAQVDLVSDPPRDNRRVFTSMPNDTIYDYTGSVFDFKSISSANSTFFAHWDMERGPGDDDFGTSMVLETSADLLQKRIPFESNDVFQAPPAGVSSAEMAQMLNVADEDEFREVVDNYRGRIIAKAGRTLNGILNGNPVVVSPPDLDLPSESYRAYKALHGDRPTMLYVPTMDGLLHGIHTGQNEGRIRVRDMKAENTTANDTTNSSVTSSEQREAWAYMPFMFLRDLASRTSSQPYLMDGTPAAKDVRLCHQNPDFNSNTAACEAICESSCGSFPAERQWRTVLVQGLGKAGTGYFAIDVTRPGQLAPNGAGGLQVTNPDPIPLWEFTPEWEKRQNEFLMGSGSTESRILPDDTGAIPDRGACSNDDEFWRESMLGISVSDPEIATLIVETDDFGSTVQLQRPVAVFGAGAPDPDRTDCGANAAGYAIYVVDLQTGSIIRRFTDFSHPDGNRYTFVEGGPSGSPGALVGSPSLYDSFPGNVATRGFIGDTFGRLFRMNFTSPNPDNWNVSLFFDPEDDSNFSSAVSDARSAIPGLSSDPFGPAGYKPAIAVNEERQPIVIYGLGEVGDAVPNNQTQAMIALREDPVSGTAVLEWTHVFELGEKLTGAPLIFNRSLYFPTYFVPNADSCAPGEARIWNLNYLPDGPGTAPEGQVDPAIASGDVAVDGVNNYYFGPTKPTLIRGLTLTLGRICSVQGIGTDTQTFVESADPQPELIAQVGGTEIASSLTNSKGGDVAGNAKINRLVAPVDPPRSEVVPLSWMVISN